MGRPEGHCDYEKHGVSFEEAATILADPDGLDGEDLDHSQHEQRRQRIALSIGRRIMKKRNLSVSSVPAKQAVRSGRHIPDSAIDFSDIPELSEEQLTRMRWIGRPATGMAKQLIAIRLSPRLLATLRQMAVKRGKPYQTLIHELLEKAASQAA